MKLKALLMVLMILGIAGAVSAEEIDARYKIARKYMIETRQTITVTAEDAYRQGVILVMGEGAPKKTAVGGARRLTAITAAKVTAQRRLAEMLQGVVVAGETTVQDSELSSDFIQSTVTGMVKGAQIVAQDWNPAEETALVIMKIGMRGPKSFAAVMYDKVLQKVLLEPKVQKTLEVPVYAPPAELPPPPAVPQPYDGLIIDATSYQFRPALINRIFSPKGEVLYDPAKISQKVLVEQGCGEYTNSVDKARAALGKRGVRNPLVVTASGTVSPSDLQVSQDVAIQIFSANQNSAFMADARVAFVLR